MNEEFIKKLNEFRSTLRNENKSFSKADFLFAFSIFGSPGFLTNLLSVLVRKNYITPQGGCRYRRYTWNPLYKNSDKTEEYAAINPNSWSNMLNQAHHCSRPAKSPKPALTVQQAIEYLKQNCPNIHIYEEFKCADGSVCRKDY